MPLVSLTDRLRIYHKKGIIFALIRSSAVATVINNWLTGQDHDSSLKGIQLDHFMSMQQILIVTICVGYSWVPPFKFSSLDSKFSTIILNLHSCKICRFCNGIIPSLALIFMRNVSKPHLLYIIDYSMLNQNSKVANRQKETDSFWCEEHCPRAAL